MNIQIATRTKLGIRLGSIPLLAPLVSAFVLQPVVPPVAPRHTMAAAPSSAGVVGSAPPTFSSAKDARSFVAESVLRNEEAPVVKSGELACQINSFRTALDGTRPLSYAIFEEAAPTAKKKKGGKNKKGGGNGGASAPGLSGPHVVLALSDSILYPEGGGQPHDTGKIRINFPESADAIELPVNEVSSINQICLLTCRLPVGEEERIADTLRVDGTTVSQYLDWDRRFDLMTQHSAQHLISAVALAEPFGYNTHSFSLSTKSDISYVDLLVDSGVDTDTHRSNIARIEEIVNNNIRLNLPMTPRYLDQEELRRAKESGEVRSRLLPEGVTGKIRLVEIGEGSAMVDQNTCGGTHVQCLGQLQMIKFFRLDRVKSNVLRVYFSAGKRLMNVMAAAYKREDTLTNIFSCTAGEIVGRVESVVDDRREKEKEIQKLNKNLCTFQAQEIVKEFDANHGVAVVDVGSADMSYKTVLANTAADLRGDMDGTLLLMVGGSESGEEGSFLLVGDEGFVVSVKEEVSKALKGRGGGRGGKFQGKGTNIRTGLDTARNIMIKSKK